LCAGLKAREKPEREHDGPKLEHYNRYSHPLITIFSPFLTFCSFFNLLSLAAKWRDRERERERERARDSGKKQENEKRTKNGGCECIVSCL